MILITGGAGFIGSNFILQQGKNQKRHFVNLDKLTRAGNLNNLSSIEKQQGYHFVKGDIRNRTLVSEILNKYQPSVVLHFAAETSIEKSGHHSESFIQTNIVGTFELLEAVTAYWKRLPSSEQANFRFMHVSTDEVYGALVAESAPFLETSPYSPHTTYAASKSSAGHLTYSYYQTHGLPTIITHAQKNFGPYQFPEKLIPKAIINALQGKSLPVQGDGSTPCSLLYVGDHTAALRLLIEKGVPGESYHISNECEISELELMRSICLKLDELKRDSPYKPHASLICHVKEKPGKKVRFLLDSSKTRALGWEPKETFEANLGKTVIWYLHNIAWVETVVSGEYRDIICSNYPELTVCNPP